MIERIIESWLTSVNERQYQLPFCQLLAAEGETIVHISTHGQFEQGKDVITKAADGTPRAYQLKNGRLTLGAWRKNRNEIVELVEYPIDHPSINSRKGHESFLVANGTVSDTVLNAIKAENKVWKRRRRGHLALIALGELVTRFVRAHGTYLPANPEHFGKFLDLMSEAGSGPLDKASLSEFIELIIPLGKKRVAFHDIRRSIASVVLLTTYIIQRFESHENHWATFEAWVVVGTYILAICEKYQVPEKWWAPSFNLCEIAAVRALEGLCAECEVNERMFTQGNPLVDGHFFRTRITVIAGLLSALSLYHRTNTSNWDGHGFVLDFLDSYRSKFLLWGESAVPYFLLSAFEFEHHNRENRGAELVASVIHSLCTVNGSNEQGVPNPYYSPEDSLRLRYRLGLPTTENFSGYSYSLEPLILFLARRLHRNVLSDLWKKITMLQFASFHPDNDWEYLRWRAETGLLRTKMPQSPQRWRDLVKVAQAPEQRFPKVLKLRPNFALFLALVFPHRLTCDLGRFLERFAKVPGR